MINQQQSLPLNRVLSINLAGDLQLLNSDLNSTSTSVVVNAFDPISSIFDIIGIPSTKINLVYNKQPLCPAMSFLFYNIQNNDTINVFESRANNSNYERAAVRLKNQQSYDQFPVQQLRLGQLSGQSPLCRCSSSSIFMKNRMNDELIERKKEDSNKNITNEELKDEYDRLTDIYRFRIESNTKSFRKLCSKYRTLVNSESGFSTKKISSLEAPSSNKRLKGISSSVETVLPEKPMYPSTDFLPAFN